MFPCLVPAFARQAASWALARHRQPGSPKKESPKGRLCLACLESGLESCPFCVDFTDVSLCRFFFSTLLVLFYYPGLDPQKPHPSPVPRINPLRSGFGVMETRCRHSFPSRGDSQIFLSRKPGVGGPGGAGVWSSGTHFQVLPGVGETRVIQVNMLEGFQPLFFFFFNHLKLAVFVEWTQCARRHHLVSVLRHSPGRTKHSVDIQNSSARRHSMQTSAF